MLLESAIITGINEIFEVVSLAGKTSNIRERRTYGLSFCSEGQITYFHKGKRIVSNKNCAVILPQGGTYSLTCDKNGSFPVINFTCAEFLCDTVVAVPIQNTGAYLKEFENMKELSLFEKNNAEIMSIFYHMIHKMAMQGTRSRVLAPAIEYIETEYKNPSLTNADLARECNISEVYFRKAFTKQYKLSPKQFITDVRINKAKQLLCEGRLKISAVATQCGFSNQYHFCRVFKKKIGVTPSEYLKNEGL